MIVQNLKTLHLTYLLHLSLNLDVQLLGNFQLNWSDRAGERKYLLENTFFKLRLAGRVARG